MGLGVDGGNVRALDGASGYGGIKAVLAVLSNTIQDEVTKQASV